MASGKEDWSLFDFDHLWNRNGSGATTFLRPISLTHDSNNRNRFHWNPFQIPWLPVEQLPGNDEDRQSPGQVQSFVHHMMRNNNSFFFLPHANTFLEAIILFANNAIRIHSSSSKHSFKHKFALDLMLCQFEHTGHIQQGPITFILLPPVWT